jgi:hypothetical protein
MHGCSHATHPSKLLLLVVPPNQAISPYWLAGVTCHALFVDNRRLLAMWHDRVARQRGSVPWDGMQRTRSGPGRKMKMRQYLYVTRLRTRTSWRRCDSATVWWQWYNTVTRQDAQESGPNATPERRRISQIQPAVVRAATCGRGKRCER